MKIQSYDVTSSSERILIQYESRSITATVTPQAKATPDDSEKDAVDLSKQLEDQIQKNKDNLNNILQESAKKLGASKIGTSVAAGAKDINQLKMNMLEQLIYMLTGKRFRSVMVPTEQQPSKQINLPSTQSAQAASRTLSMTSLSYEYESVSYSAKGIINTADGQKISVDIGFSMSREFSSYASVTMGFNPERLNVCDPLVINYAGTAASLTNEKFQFDLDFDGRMDQISFAGQGSGFLALDKNGDGVINDGSELFGPSTGNGFSELRAYDKDGNGWIDENDAIYSQLRIWSKDADGNDQLFTLKELDIGAIYLGDISTEFSINDQNNNTQGVMRSTSFFLKDSGGAGTISHVDLSI